jgi:putative transposase
MIWILPKNDTEYSKRWSAIKSRFTRAWLARGGVEQSTTESYQKRGNRGVWQPRFMEHTIRDEDDLIRHVEYIHFNPVKHGLADRPGDWSWSSFSQYVKQGIYDVDWGTAGSHIDQPLCSTDNRYLE